VERETAAAAIFAFRVTDPIFHRSPRVEAWLPEDVAEEEPLCTAGGIFLLARYLQCSDWKGIAAVKSRVLVCWW